MFPSCWNFVSWVASMTADREALVIIVPKAQLTINGPLKKYSSKGSSGYDVHRLFCSECGSPIIDDPDVAPEVIAIKGGTLDSDIKQTLKPVGFHILSCIITLVKWVWMQADPYSVGY